MSRLFAFRALAVCLATLGVLFSIALCLPATAFAQGKKALAVGLIEGPQGEPTRKRMLAALKKSGAYEITDAEDLRPNADKGAYAAMAQALQVDAIIVGKTSKSLDLTLNVIGPDGNQIQEVKIKGGSGPKLEKAVDTEVVGAIGGALGGKKAAPPDEEEAAPEDEEEAAPEDEEDAEVGAKPKKDDDDDDEEETTPPPPEEKKSGLRPLELLVGMRLYSRKFTYRDYQDQLGVLYPYELALAPAIIASARVYPFAFGSDGVLSNVGIMGKFEVGIATKASYVEQTTDPPTTYPLNTGTSEWQIGLRGRLPIGQSELGMFGLFGTHAFVLVGDEGPMPQRPEPLVPDVNYQFLRFGFDARLRVSKLTVSSHFAPRFLTTMHNVDQTYWWFPGATGSGVDFGASLGYEVLKFLDLAVGVDFLRYGFDFNGIPSDAGSPDSAAQKIAGGATDTYLSAWLGVIFHLDGKTNVEDGAISAEVTPKSEPEPDPDTEPADAEE